MWNKIKRILVWTQQVRPPITSFTYDFANKSVSTLTNDWWERPDWSSGVSFSSAWMYKSGSGYKRAIYPMSFAWANEITITWHIYNSSDRDFAMWLEYYNGSTWNTATIMWSTSYSDTKLRVRNTSNTLIDTLFSGGALPSGDHTVVITINIWNKTVSFSDGTNSGSYTLTDADVTAISSSNWIRCAVAKSWNVFKDVAVTIS